MNEREIYEEIEKIKKEIERIETTFPPNSARILIKDMNYKLDKLYEQVCPF